MAKSLFDLDDEEDARHEAHDIREATEFLSDLEDLQNDDRYQWALTTIEGIHETVTRTNTVTSNQRRAIENITKKVERGYGR
jgi:hypothetical protein